jgi:hypothetical protein
MGVESPTHLEILPIWLVTSTGELDRGIGFERHLRRVDDLARIPVDLERDALVLKLDGLGVVSDPPCTDVRFRFH